MPEPSVHLIHFSSRPGGIEVLMPVIVNSLINYRFHAFVIRPPETGKTNVYQDLPIPVSYGHTSNPRALIQLWKYSRKHRQDIFHLFNTGPYYFFLLRWSGIQNVVYSIRGTIYWKKKRQQWLRKLFWWLALSLKNHIILANSEYSKHCFLEATGYKGIVEVIYNPININRFSCSNRLYQSGIKKIIYSGRLDSGKNLFRWLDVAKIIHKHYPGIIFELYGEGQLEQKLKIYADQAGLQEVVFFKGFRSDIENVYREADLLLFLSEYESFGNVVVESILCGTPVIASAIPSMKEIFINFPDFLVELDDQLESNVLNKIHQIEHLRSLVKPAQEEFRQRFSMQKHIERLDSIYQSLLINR